MRSRNSAGAAKKTSPARVFALVGDGELQEGQVWEAVQFAAHQKLENFVIIVDHNGKQLDDRLEAICNPFDLTAKFQAFGMPAHVAVGYDVASVHTALTKALAEPTASVAILDTFKGIGCYFAEEADFCHYMNFGPAEAAAAEAEILRRLEKGTVLRED